MKILFTLATLVASGVVFTTAAVAQIKVDPAIKPYVSVSGVSGNLNSIGSDTLNNLMTLWAEGFRAIYPNVNIQIEGKGSSTAPVALIEGTAQLGPMSRAMKGSEIDAFEKKYGYKPLEIKVSIDALAVYVHKDSPLKSLSLQQVDSIFSSTNRMGGKPINTWGEVGLVGEFANRPISLFGRNSASGTYGFYKDVALGGGDYGTRVKEQPGSSAVVQGVASDIYAMGYSGIGYKTSGVNAIALASKPGGKAYEPNPENCLSGDYPLARFLYIYVNKDPKKPMDKLTKEFLSFVLSKAGQEVVAKDGYFPMPAALCEEVKAGL
ncbi:MAG: phosphate ABC transporter substrate-binding protein [Candidatus Didemnitutus sp.]|nr:phosphate ABC transporter substrate-binding protein [Candidatus Didemnitutus sp.]